jgi:hypothetical protein
VLVYLPIFDVWHNPEGVAIGLTVHRVGWLDGTPCGNAADALFAHGCAADFVSDDQLAATGVDGATLVTEGGTRYAALMLPRADHVPPATVRKVIELARGGATVLVVGALPKDVPGLAKLEDRRAELRSLIEGLNLPSADAAGMQQVSFEGGGRLIVGPTAEALAAAADVRREPMADGGLRFIRRATGDGIDYFIANLTGEGFDGWTALGTTPRSAAIMDPLTGNAGIAALRRAGERTEVYLQLAAGESAILRTWNKRDAAGPAWRYLEPAGEMQMLTGDWQLTFIEGGPELPKTATVPAPVKGGTMASWTDLGDEEGQRFAGTGVYRLEFDAPENAAANDALLDLGDVRESARVRLNGQPVAVLWGLPMRTRLGDALKPGKNVLEVEVTNLAANRIRDLDQRGVEWKIFYDTNIVNINYRPFDASDWPVVPSGLLGPVTVMPMKVKSP